MSAPEASPRAPSSSRDAFRATLVAAGPGALAAATAYKLLPGFQLGGSLMPASWRGGAEGIVGLVLLYPVTLLVLLPGLLLVGACVAQIRPTAPRPGRRLPWLALLPVASMWHVALCEASYRILGYTLHTAGEWLHLIGYSSVLGFVSLGTWVWLVRRRWRRTPPEPPRSAGNG